MNPTKRPNEEPTVVALVSRRGPGNDFTTQEVAQPYNEYPNPPEVEGRGLVEYFYLLRRHAVAIFLSCIAGAALCVLMSLPISPIYKVSSSLEILNVNQDFMNTKETSPVTTTDQSYETSEEETQVELLQSDALALATYKKLDPDFATLDQPRSTSFGWLRSLFHLSRTRPLTRREKLLGSIQNSLKVINVPRTRVLTIDVKSTDAQLAVDYSNTLAALFIQQNLEAKFQATQRVGDWLSKELDGIRTNLRHSEDALQSYARTSGLIFTEDDTSLETQKLLQLQQQVSTATTDRVGKQSAYDLAQNSPPDSLPDVLNDDNLREAQAKINDLRGQIADLSARFTPEFGKVKSAQAQLAALTASYAHDRAAVVERVNKDYQAAKERESLLAAAYDSQFGKVTGEGEKAVQYNILKRDVDSNRQLYDLMLQQMNQSSIAAALRASNVRIVDAASIPNKPWFPNFPIMGAVGLFLGLITSVVFIIGLEKADRTLQRPGDAQLWTKLVELGTIPNALTSDKREVYGPVNRVNMLQAGDRLSTDKPRLRSQPVELITSRAQPSIVAEAFRSLLTSVLFIGENGSRPQLLVLTSSGPAEGKTTVVTNLAIAMAEIGSRVLIIDADLRRPRIHNIFGLPNDTGLSTLLKDKAFSEESITDMIFETAIPGLSVLPSGQPTFATANLLYSPNLPRIFNQVRQNFDMILVDTPPMLQMTDARVIGRLADAVVLVARADRTTRDAIIAANQRFSGDRTRVLGTVLNGWDPKRSSAGYYGQNRYYAYRYGYTSRPENEG